MLDYLFFGKQNMYLLSWNVLLNIKDYFSLNVLCKSAGLEENQDNITRRTKDYSQSQECQHSTFTARSPELLLNWDSYLDPFVKFRAGPVSKVFQFNSFLTSIFWRYYFSSNLSQSIDYERAPLSSSCFCLFVCFFIRLSITK